MDPAVPILVHFEYLHLPEHLRAISKEFHDLAHRMVAALPKNGAERSEMLRCLLNAKDSAVRSRRVEQDA